jgi:peptide/nickel transport system permease protein
MDLAGADTLAGVAERAVQPPRRLRKLLHNRNLMIGGSILLVMTLAAIFAPWLTPYDPLTHDNANTLQPPSLEHPFGTDNFGRDVFTRVLYGGRIDMRVGVIAVIAPFIIGVTLGCLAGYFGGFADTLTMRAVDILIAFPGLVFIIFMVAILGPGLRNMYIAVAIFAWIVYARLIRSSILAEKHKEYVVAAQAIGGSHKRIVGQHVFPNVITPCIVFAFTDIALYIGLTAGLRYLGLGERPPTPEWGAMVAGGQAFMTTAWWMSALPGAAIVLAGIAFSIFGDGIGDALRPGHR